MDWVGFGAMGVMGYVCMYVEYGWMWMYADISISKPPLLWGMAELRLSLVSSRGPGPGRLALASSHSPELDGWGSEFEVEFTAEKGGSDFRGCEFWTRDERRVVNTSRLSVGGGSCARARNKQMH